MLARPDVVALLRSRRRGVNDLTGIGNRWWRQGQGDRAGGIEAVNGLAVQPRLVLVTFRDALWFLVAIPLLEGIEMMQDAGWLPVLLQLP